MERPDYRRDSRMSRSVGMERAGPEGALKDRVLDPVVSTIGFLPRSPLARLRPSTRSAWGLRSHVCMRGRTRSVTEQKRLPSRPLPTPDSDSRRLDVAEQHIHAKRRRAVRRHERIDAGGTNPLRREINELRRFPYTAIKNHDWLRGPNALDAAHNKSVVCASTSS